MRVDCAERSSPARGRRQAERLRESNRPGSGQTAV